jgi:hypothetical protein
VKDRGVTAFHPIMLHILNDHFINHFHATNEKLMMTGRKHQQIMQVQIHFVYCSFEKVYVFLTSMECKLYLMQHKYVQRRHF